MAKAPAKRPAKGLSAGDPEVDAFLRALKHPHKDDISAVRPLVLGVSPQIRDGIKWNSMSFRTTEWFATVNWRYRDGVQLVLHKGAKVKNNSATVKIADPGGLIRWLASDRCLVTVGAGKEFAKNRKALVAIVRAWINGM
jgi:hypothetical protein